MISLLVVNYRSSALALEAIRSARASSARPLQVVVVDNSCDPWEAERLRGNAEVVIVSKTNRGYAGAINDGRPYCVASTLVICNPDVSFDAHAIDRLDEALREGASVAGPALFWDHAFQWMLPPAERHTGIERLSAVLASRSGHWRVRRDRQRTRARIAFWRSTSTRVVDSISGAVMAVRGEVFDSAGGFDERFALYFEETDFLRRVASSRGRIVSVPGARCRHLYNQSAGQDPDRAGRLFAQSELRYFAKWNGPFLASVMKRLEKPRDPDSRGVWRGERIEVPPGMLVEASPLASFETAAGHFAQTATVALPREVTDVFRGEAIHLRVVDPSSGEVLSPSRSVS